MTTTRSDCGCGDDATPYSPTRTVPDTAATVGAPSGATGTVSPLASQTPGGTVVLDGFQGLNPVDGLFLRADHLKLIQDYARSLTTAVATASGPGVVHGLGVQLLGEALEVSPGLAVSPRGRLLLLSSTVRIQLDDVHVPSRPPDGFWRVELHWATGTSGSAPVYGSLCNDTCADGGATIQPWRDEGMEIRVVADSFPGLDAAPFDRRRNWLASAYFERERSGGQPWLVPVGAGSRVSLWSHDWDDSTPLPQEAGVSLALLHSVDAAYELDVWAARRLVGGPSANSAWRERLAMRPWPVFLAQILQFEAEITGLTLEGPAPVGANVYQETAKSLLDEIQLFVATVKGADPVRSRHSFQRLEEVMQQSEGNPVATSEPAPLTAQPALGELPPAGYLNVRNPPGGVDGDLRVFFGPNLDLRLRQMRADQVADEVMAAQHRDRIPLEPIAGRRPEVDILVPDVPADRSALSTDAYGWVAFVRRGPGGDEAPPPPHAETEDVDVCLLFDAEPQRFAREFTESDVKAAIDARLGTLTFPQGGWAFPGGEVSGKVLDLLANTSAVCVVVLTRADDRPLAAVRAALFAASLDSGSPLPVYARGKEPLEAIVVIAAAVIN